MDLCAFEERAAVREFDGGQTRFAAETAAAAEQGRQRWEFMDAIRQRDTARGGDHRPGDERDAADHVPGVQPAPKEAQGPVPVGDVQGGRSSVVLPPLRAQRGQVSR